MLNRSAALKRRPTHLARKLGDVTRWPGLRLKGYTLAFGESPGMTLPLVEGKHQSSNCCRVASRYFVASAMTSITSGE